MSRALSDAERRAWLRLARTQTVGPVTFANLISRYPNPIDALAAVPHLARRGGGNELRVPSDDDARKELDTLGRLGGRMIASIEPDFPSQSPFATTTEPSDLTAVTTATCLV